MDVHSILRDASSIGSTINVFVLAAGYYLLIRLYRRWFHETQRARIAGGRPQVVVALDHGRLPEVVLALRNFTDAPAREISFDFSAPVRTPDGRVLSDLPFFAKGLSFFEPEGRIDLFWGHLHSLAPLLREQGLEDGIKVTVRYKDLAEEPYETVSSIDPLLFEGTRIEGQKDINDLVNAVERLSEEDEGRDERRTVSRSGKG